MKGNISSLLKLVVLITIFLLNVNSEQGLAKESNDSLTIRSSADRFIFASRERLAIRAITQNSEKVGRNQLLELTVDLSATYDNPFDPGDIDVSAQFISPSGKQVLIPGFFYQEYTRIISNKSEGLRNPGPAVWKVRFAASESGQWKYRITARDRSGLLTSEEKSFEVIKSEGPGYIHPNPNHKQYLQFDSGAPFIPIGGGIGWTRNILSYEYYLTKAAENKCNYMRIWMVPWNLALEWTNVDWQNTRYFGLGKYNLKNAWRIDRILEIAEQKGIYIVFTLGNYGELMREKGVWNEGMWQANPYNITNGGPCKNPEEFWTNEEARRYYKNRLRYIISRWGYSTNIFSFELWNEVYAPVEWVKEMSGFIKQVDHSRHMVTISLGYEKNPEYPVIQLWNLDNIDYTQLHIWGSRGEAIDLVERLDRESTDIIAKYAKPCLVAEFGIDAFKDDRFYDKEAKGINLHNGLWAGVFSGCLGSAMGWWWDSYVEPHNLYYHYKALANFVGTIDWSQDWQITKIAQDVNGSEGRVRILGLRNNNATIIWIQNKQSNWYTNYQGIEPQCLEGVAFNLFGMPEGQYKLQWWDTHEGKILNEIRTSSVNGELLVEVPKFKRDIAVKIVATHFSP